ncbi:MAG: hypothetical protein R3242_04215 [Akkermansiaceae bacterium]|nr:hypothetical protein [Akkermansiaceae bacterium]
MAFEPIMTRPWSRKLGAKLSPALLTLGLAMLLAIDFDDIVYRAYLAIIFYYLVFVGLCLIAWLICWKRSGSRSTMARSWLILLVASVSFPFTAPLSEKIVQDHTSWNRVYVHAVLQYEGENHYDFHVSAYGRGSRDSLTIDSGFTNISINRDHTGGPSLNYRLKPDLVFVENEECEVNRIPKSKLKSLFEEKGMGDIATKANLNAYTDLLEKMSEVSSFEAFESELGHLPGAEFGFTPLENAVYRLSFLMVSIEALLLPLLLTSLPRGEGETQNG